MEAHLGKETTSPLEYKMKIQEQFRNINKEMLAVCEDGVIKGQ